MRNLLKHRFYTLLNIIGLSVGITCFLFNLLYVWDESRYDAHHANTDRLYRLNFHAKLGDQVVNSAASPNPAGPVFGAELPEVETYCRVRNMGNVAVRRDNQVFKEENALFVDSTFFRLFSFRLLEGDPASVLCAPNAVVISQSLAAKYFGGANPVGRPLTVGSRVCQVSGVMEDMPENTHFKAPLLQSMRSLEADFDNNWGSTSTHNYFLLHGGSDVQMVSTKATGVFVHHFAPVLKEAFNTSWEDFEKAGNYARVELFPVRDIHLHSNLEDELGVNGDAKLVYIFGLIGLFILMLACVNFVNLTTARSIVRAKEVGVRKAVGAMRGDLIRQFLGESLLMSGAATLIALIAVRLLVPFFNTLSGKALTAAFFADPAFWLTAGVVALLSGLLAGSYPAFLLSKFQPGRVLRAGGVSGALSAASVKSGDLRSGLVVFQFCTTVALSIGALVVYQQLAYMRGQKLGFNKENVLVVKDAHLLGNQWGAFKKSALQEPGISQATYCSGLPAFSLTNSFVVYKGRSIAQDNAMLINNWWGDYDYAKTMNVEIAEGRDFSREMATDSMAVLVNETLAKTFGYPQKPILGEEISLSSDANNRPQTYHIVGVVRDFHISALRERVEPLAIYRGDPREYLALRFETAQVEVLLKKLQRNWAEMAPDKPFDYAFLDQRFDLLYATEARTEKVVGLSALLAAFIACVGLFGLATFMTGQRTKEIGIRKVLGASVASVTNLLVRDFVKLVAVAIVLASPVAYFFMKKWLSDFAYRIEMEWWMFAGAGLAAVAIAFLTVGFQSVRAALANPVKSLRSE
jgi:putative ABC transport system permease protein